MLLEQVDAYPWFLSKTIRLSVNDRPVNVRINPTEWSEHWRPLLAKLLELHHQRPKRLMIAIVGPPGCGKSVFTEQLNWMIFRGILGKQVRSAALQMDAFHYPNAYLQTHFRDMPDGSKLSLSMVKGAPDTIDVEALRKKLEEIRACPEEVVAPAYSRMAHDPIADAIRIHISSNIILMDGNYLLSPQPPFAGLRKLFDLGIYIDIPAPKILSNLMERHIKGGKSVDEAKAWVKSIDLPNAKLAEQSKACADVIVSRLEEDHLSGVAWRGQDLSLDAGGEES